MSFALEQEFRELVRDHHEVSRLCQQALDDWVHDFDKDVFLGNLLRYTNLKDEDLQTKNELACELYQYFKNTRKTLQYFRTIFIIFDQAHFAPAHLHNLYKYLGKFKDCFWTGEKNAVRVSQLVDILNSTNNWTNWRIIVDKDELILDQAETIWAEIRQLLANQELTAVDFHTLRKRLRIFTNIFTVINKYNHDPRVSSIKMKLVQINDTLGDINDLLVQNALLGLTSYENQVVSVDDSLRVAIAGIFSGQSG